MNFFENLPLFSILLPMLFGIVGFSLGPKASKALAIGSMTIGVLLSGMVFGYTIFTASSFTYWMGHFPAPFGNEIRAGMLEGILALVFSLIMLLSVLGGGPDTARDIPRKKMSLFYVMTQFLLAALFVVVYTNDIFTAYVFIDIITIAACTVLAAKPGGQTLIATMKYLILSLAGSTLILLAIALLYSITGHLLMPQLGAGIAALVSSEGYALPLALAFALLVGGLGIKSALFPFHSWLPDAHTHATTTASAILSGLVIKCYLILLIKLIVRVFGQPLFHALHISDALLIMGVLGLLFGSVSALRQRHIKRMLSYASISQIGLICMGIGLGSDAGLQAALFHILAHACAKSMLFVSAGGLVRAGSGGKDIAALRGAGRRDILSGIAFAVGGVSMIGVPLFSGFVSKFLLASASLEHPIQAGIVLVGIALSTLLNVMYYVPVIVTCFAKTADESVTAAATIQGGVLYRAVLLVFIAVNLLLGIAPQGVLGVLEQGLRLF